MYYNGSTIKFIDSNDYSDKSFLCQTTGEKCKQKNLKPFLKKNNFIKNYQADADGNKLASETK
jgi:hypothetical protein